VRAQKVERLGAGCACTPQKGGGCSVPRGEYLAEFGLIRVSKGGPFLGAVNCGLGLERVFLDCL
jgi:hypothetical protein